MLNPGLKDTIAASALPTGAATSANQTNGTQKTLLVGQKNDGTGLGEVQTTADGGLVINQNIQVDNSNSTTTNLGAGATFTGVSKSNIDSTAIQVMLKTDQNCTVYVDQSGDGVNWDVTDSYPFYAAIGNFAPTVNAVGAFYRVRVTNLGSSATTYFRLQSILVPILPALPRTTDKNNNLKVATQSIVDQYGFYSENTPYGESRVVEPVKLVGSTFTGNTLDTNFWISTTTSGGTNTILDGQLTMRTNTTANGSAIIHSVRTARYLSGASNRFRATVRLPTAGTANNVRRWGMADATATNGAFFELNGTSLRVVTRKNGVDTVVTNFNGNLGSTLQPDTNIQAYEIYYTLNTLYFTYNDVLLHTVSASTTTWSSTPNLGVFLENTNSAGSTTDVQMEVRIANIYRLGKLSTSPTRYHTTGAGTYTLKIGAGLLHAININSAGAPASSLTIYDNTSGTGSVIGVIDASKIPSPMPIPYNGGVNFDIGLTLVQVGTFDTTIIYE